MSVILRLKHNNFRNNCMNLYKKYSNSKLLSIIIVLIFISINFPIQSIPDTVKADNQRNEFEDDFNTLNNWYLVVYDKAGGSANDPEPRLDTSMGRPSPSLDVNGDSWCGNGAYSKERFDYTNGLSIQFDMYVARGYDWNWGRGGLSDHDPNLNHQRPDGAYVDKTRGGTSHLAGISFTDDGNYNNRHPYIRFNIKTKDGSYDSYTYDSDAREHQNEWHTYKIKIQKDGYVQFYMDEDLKWTSTEKIDISLKQMPILFGDRDAYGPVRIDNVKISNGVTQKSPKFTVYIDDAEKAPGNKAIVNKASNDIGHITAEFTNNKQSTEKYDLYFDVPKGVKITSIFSRNDFGDYDTETLARWKDTSPREGYIRYNTYVYVPSGEKQQVVARFDLPRYLQGKKHMVHAGVKLGGEYFYEDEDSESYNILTNPSGIIVTNRYKLFDEYNDEEVIELLQYLHSISDGNKKNEKECIIYFADYYEPDIKDWDNSELDFGSDPNYVSNLTDGWIYNWYMKMKSIKYVMIVGGDEIVPFYRFNIDDLWCHPTTSGKMCESDFSSGSDTYAHGYMFTDNPYADIDQNEKWKNGDLELAIGRIIGTDPLKLKSSVQSGIQLINNPSNNAVVASGSGSKGSAFLDAGTLTPKSGNSNHVANIPKILRNLDYDVLYDNENAKQSTIDNRNWGASDLYNALNKGYDLFFHLGHGGRASSKSAICIDKGIYANNEYKWDKNNLINKYHPVIISASCHGGFVNETMDSSTQLATKLMELGVSNYIGNSGYGTGWGRIGGSDYIECFLQLFAKKIKSSADSNSVGELIRLVKNDPEVFKRHTERGIKTLTETVVYGVPWHHINLPLDSTKGDDLFRHYNKDIKLSISNPVEIGKNSYQRQIQIEIQNYIINETDNFDMVSINGSKENRITDEPVVPYISIPLYLPQNITYVDVDVRKVHNTSLGPLDLPILSNKKWGNYTNQSELKGLNPDPLVWIDDTNTMSQNFVKLMVNQALVQHDPNTKETILYNKTLINLTYNTSNQLLFRDISLSKHNFNYGESINITYLVENCGINTIGDLKVNISIYNTIGDSVKFFESIIGSIESNKEKLVCTDILQNFDQGQYFLTIELYREEMLLLKSDAHEFFVSTGDYYNLKCPEYILFGDVEKVEFDFINSKNQRKNLTGVIHVYDENNTLIDKIYSNSINITRQAFSLNVSIKTRNYSPGTYYLSSFIMDDSEYFGPISNKIIIKTDIKPPNTIEHIYKQKYGQKNKWITPSSIINLSATDDLSGVDQIYYRIWQDGLWNPAPGFGVGVNNNFMVYTDNFTLSGEGKHYIEFYSEDNAGNVEAVTNQTHNVYDWWCMRHHDPLNTGCSKTSIPQTPELAWLRQHEYTIDSSPAVVYDGKLFIGSQNGELYCLDADDGSMVWQAATNGRIKSSPAVSDGKVFVGSADQNLYCFNAEDGHLEWNSSTGGSVFSSPTVVDERVLVGSNNGFVSCFNTDAGTLQWKTLLKGFVFSTPAVSDGMVFAGSAGGKMVCMDLDTGMVLWQYQSNGIVFSSAVVNDDYVLMGSVDGNLYCFDVMTGVLLWQQPCFGGVVSSPVIMDDDVYIVSTGGQLMCINVSNGALQWTSFIGPVTFSSPALSDDGLVVGSVDGFLYCVNTGDGSLRWRYPVGTGICSSPALFDGRVFVGSDGGSVFCLTEEMNNVFVTAASVSPESQYMDRSILFESVVTGPVMNVDVRVTGPGGDETLFGMDPSGEHEWRSEYIFDEMGLYTCVVEAADGMGNMVASDPLDFEVIAGDNLVPEAGDDTYEIAAGEVLEISAPGLLGNDDDPDAAPSGLTVDLVDDVSYGMLQLASDGSFTYYPDTGFTGVDSFTYTISDGADESGVATVSITVSEEDEPVSVGDINGDGRVNVGDVRYLAKHLANDPAYTELFDDGDVNSDGRVNVGDVRYLAKHLAHDPNYTPLYP